MLTSLRSVPFEYRVLPGSAAVTFSALARAESAVVAVEEETTVGSPLVSSGISMDTGLPVVLVVVVVVVVVAAVVELLLAMDSVVVSPSLLLSLNLAGLGLSKSRVAFFLDSVVGFVGSSVVILVELPSSLATVSGLTVDGSVCLAVVAAAVTENNSVRTRTSRWLV